MYVGANAIPSTAGIVPSNTEFNSHPHSEHAFDISHLEAWGGYRIRGRELP